MDDVYIDEVETAAPAPTPNLPDVKAATRSAMPGEPRPVQTLNVARAQHILNKFTADPSWLADPRTSKAANAVFGAASKVISMNLQLERVNNSGLAARNQQALLKRQLDMADEVAKFAPEAVASFYVPGENGQMPITDLSKMPEIAALYKQHVKPEEKQFAPGMAEKDEEYIQRLIADGAPQEQIDRVRSRIYSKTQDVIDHRDYVKRIGVIDPDSRREIESINDPKLRMQALSLAEEVVRERTKNVNKEAKAEAIRSGAVVSTTIKDGSVTQTFRPPPAKKEDTQFPEPVVKTIEGKPFMFYRNFSPKPMDKLSPKLQELVKVASAELRAARKELGENPDDEDVKARYEAAKVGFEKLFPDDGRVEKKRVRVKGPNGATGTIEEGDTLPSGWSLE